MIKKDILRNYYTNENLTKPKIYFGFKQLL